MEAKSQIRNASEQFKWASCNLSPHIAKDGRVYCNYFIRYINPSDCFRVLYSSKPVKFYDQKDNLITLDQLILF